MLERRENFAHELGKYEVPETALPRTRKAFTGEKPDDVQAWVASYASEMGWKQRNSQPAASGNGTPSPTPPPPPGPGPNVPRTPPPAAHVVTEDTPLMRQSPTDREALRRKIGDLAFADRLMKEVITNNVRVPVGH